MQYKMTLEGYPVLLKTKTTSRFFSEDRLANRRTPWVYLTQNPKGRWQVLAPDPEQHGEIVCIAGGKNATQVLPVMTEYAYAQGILKRGTPTTQSALMSLGSFVTRAHQAAANAAH
jgi:hypothetical protein